MGQITRQVTIQVTAAALNVRTLVSPTSGYVGDGFLITVENLDWVSGPCDFTVDFGDGTSDSITGIMAPVGTFTKIYASPGTYVVTGTAYDYTLNTSGSDTATARVYAVLDATFTADPTSGIAPLDVVFTGTISGGLSPYSWSLDFGDGSTPQTGTTTSINVSHTYATAGTYMATLTVTDDLGVTMLAQSFPVKALTSQQMAALAVIAGIFIALVHLGK